MRAIKSPGVRRILILLIILALWELLTRSGLISPLLLAGPSAIGGALQSDWIPFGHAIRITMGELIVAVPLTWFFGVAIGIAIGISPAATRLTRPTISAAFAVPLIIWYPLLVVWFGIGPMSKVVFGVVFGIFPIIMASVASVQQIDRLFLQFSRSIGLPMYRTAFSIIPLLALPSIVAGLRIGTALTVLGIIVAEMLASTGGVGYFISINRTIFNTGQVYLGITFAVLLTFLVNRGLGMLEDRLGQWRSAQKLELSG